MKKSISFVFLAFLATLSYGQGKYALKIYQNSDFFHTLSGYGSKVVGMTRKMNYNRLSIALTFQSLRFSHEIELFIPEIMTSTNTARFPFEQFLETGGIYKFSTTSYSFRYEINKTFFDITRRLRLNLGFGANPFYTRTWGDPMTGGWVNFNQLYYGVAFNIIPRINFKFSDRLSLDLNAPFRIFDAQVVTQHVNNPNIPIRQQTSTEPDYILFRKIYNIRLGLVYRLGIKEKALME